MNVKLLFVAGVFLLIFSQHVSAQVINTEDKDKNLTFTGTKVIPDDSEFDSTGTLVLSGYMDTYFAYYNDSIPRESFQQLPTVAPYSNRFGLNIAQIGGVYKSDNFRGKFTFHWGDIPQSAWSQKYNYIQEANIGCKIIPKLWLDVGMFRTHIGLESIQPRENIASSLATTTYFEPYFMSGAKLTYRFNSKLLLQANVFNGFNTFIETNKNKAYGLSAVITPNKRLSITINSITTDESDDDFPRKQQRLYNNMYLVYHSKKLDIGAEYNFGLQQNTKLTDTTETAYMQSALVAIKYKITKQFAVYAREEYFSDPNEILTGPIQNSHHKLVGLDFIGETIGVEVKPMPNAYIRLEGRTLHSKPTEDIFTINHTATNHREEVLFTMGVWF